jgi:hypothetical protein
MRNQILSLVVLGFCTLSCSTENIAVNNAESMKSDEMINFDKALKSLLKPENQSTPEEKSKSKSSTELNEKSKQILYEASKDLILSNDVQIKDLNTFDNKERTISLATKIYFEKYNDIQKQIKSEK